MKIFKVKKLFIVLFSSFLLVSCQKIIFYWNKSTIIKEFKDHFGWNKNLPGWGSETDNKTWNQYFFAQYFEKDLDNFVSSTSYINNFKDKNKQWNSILYLPQTFSFNERSLPSNITQSSDLENFKYTFKFSTSQEFELCYFLNDIGNFSPKALNNSLLTDESSQIWKYLFNNISNNDKNYQVNLIVKDKFDDKYYLASYSLDSSYSDLKLNNIYFLDQNKINNLTKHLINDPKIINTDALKDSYSQADIDNIKKIIINSKSHLSFFKLKDTINSFNETNINSNYNYQFFKDGDYKNSCNKIGKDFYTCSVNNFLDTGSSWKSDASIGNIIFHDINNNNQVDLIANLEITYDDQDNPIRLEIKADNFYYNSQK